MLLLYGNLNLEPRWLAKPGVTNSKAPMRLRVAVQPVPLRRPRKRRQADILFL